MIGLIGAMAEEISLLKDNMKHTDKSVHAGMEYLTGSLHGQEFVLLKSGIGKVNATIGTQIMIDKFPIERIIFTGLAGTLVPNLSRGDIVVSNYVVQYDFDLTTFGRRYGELPDVGRLIEADPVLVKLACYAFDDIFKSVKGAPRLVVGTIASGDRFIADERQIEWLQREFGAVAIEMEGAAIGYTCHVNKVPFAIIRTISDTGGSNAKDEFESFLSQASQNSFKMIDSFFQTIAHKTTAET
jgi:adenosylhomocysteine nucleosidase